jgi:hypothetical protein
MRLIWQKSMTPLERSTNQITVGYEMMGPFVFTVYSTECLI